MIYYFRARCYGSDISKIERLTNRRIYNLEVESSDLEMAEMLATEEAITRQEKAGIGKGDIVLELIQVIHIRSSEMWD